MPRKPSPDALALFDTLVYTCQYRLVIDPASNVLARVLEWKQLLRDRIGVFGGAFHLPGIALFHSELPPDYERGLGDAVAQACAGCSTFTLSITGLARSEDRKTIFLELLEKEAIAVLRGRIVDHVRTNRRIKKLGVDVDERPMLTIASGLKPGQFATAWALLEASSFSAQQRVSDVVLMKRELDDTSLDEHVRTFPLDPSG